MPEESAACDKNLMGSDLCHMKVARPLLKHQGAPVPWFACPRLSLFPTCAHPRRSKSASAGGLFGQVSPTRPGGAPRLGLVLNYSRLCAGFGSRLASWSSWLCGLRRRANPGLVLCFRFFTKCHSIGKVVAVLIGENLVTAAVGEAFDSDSDLSVHHPTLHEQPILEGIYHSPFR